jgi:hypothetical protein
MPQPKLYRNYVAAVLWAFVGLWVSGVLAMSYLLWRDGPPPGTSAWFAVAVFATFWIFAVAALGFAASRPCTRVSIGADGRISILQRYPHRAIRGEFSTAQVGAATLVADRDSDGDPYFICQLAIGYPFDEPIRIAEGGREHCENIRSDFEARIAALATADRDSGNRA